MKNVKSVWVFGIFIFILIAIWMQIKTNERAKKDYEKFYSANIDSHIKSVKIANHGSMIMLIGGESYIFYPYTDVNLNDRNKFNYTAKMGDRVIKPSYSDTLLLITSKGNLKYTFKKFNY